MQISHLQVFEMFCKNMFKSSVLIVVLVSTAIFSISDANIAFASLPATRAGSLQDIQFKTTGANFTFAHNMCFVNQLVKWGHCTLSSMQYGIETFLLVIRCNVSAIYLKNISTSTRWLIKKYTIQNDRRRPISHSQTVAVQLFRLSCISLNCL